MEKIKKIGTKDSNNSFPFYPIGIDGIYADMLSGNNLEEELHLGSPSFTSFAIDTNGVMTIIEQYKKVESQVDNYYMMTTTFETIDDNNMKIVQTLFFRNKDSDIFEPKKVKNITFTGSGSNLEIKEVIE